MVCEIGFVEYYYKILTTFHSSWGLNNGLGVLLKSIRYLMKTLEGYTEWNLKSLNLCYLC